jgi:CYTH domain-containing protein
MLEMVDRINDIAWQAHQGSVAAIIQLLNEKLAESGVRTRAIFADGVLQLLCEASKIEQLEQSSLVEQIQQILESIAPRNIRRVNINSRIVREAQLLWLKDIYNGENQVLWSQEITLTKPHTFKQIIEDLAEAKNELAQSSVRKGKSSRTSVLTNQNKRKYVPKSKMPAAVSLGLLLLLGWVVYSQLGDKLKIFIQVESSKPVTMANANATKSAVSTTKNNSVTTAEQDDPFGSAVRIANQATIDGKTATTSIQWLDLAAKWQRASDLMGAVPTTHVRYKEAQIRTQLYREYSETAQKEAEKSKTKS